MTKTKISRRDFTLSGVAAAATLAAPSVITAQSRTIRLGYVSATSGQRASFGVSDNWMVEQIARHLSGGVEIDGAQYDVEILARDNQSSFNRSAAIGSELILREGVDLLLLQDGDATVAIGEMSDINGVPTMTTMIPWQAWMFPRGSTPDQGFPWNFNFFWGVGDAMSTFTRIWDQVDTNRIVGDFYLDNPAGLAFANPDIGLPRFMDMAGYSRVPGGIYKFETDDFSAQVSAFRDADAQIVTGYGTPPNWTTFWNQAAQGGYSPEVCSFAGAFLFPEAINALGDRGDGMSTEVWWTPDMPFASSLTGQSARDIAEAWRTDTGRQWVQTMGYSHAPFEIGLQAVKIGGKDPAAIRDAMSQLTLDTMVGPVDFAGSPIRSVARTELAGGQWRTSSGAFEYELVVTENTLAPSVPVASQTVALSQL